VNAHKATTANLGALYPFVAEGGINSSSVLIGRDLIGGGHFAYNPFKLYNQQILTNPNMVVIGQIGKGKSAFIKTYLWRLFAFGTRFLVLDPKGEYTALAKACGSEPLKLAPGGCIRLNPLEMSETQRTNPNSSPALHLLYALASSALSRELSPLERAVLEASFYSAWAKTSSGHVRSVTLNHIVETVLSPPLQIAKDLRCGLTELRDASRDMALELRRLVQGDLKGMFDGATTKGISLDAQAVVLDLSALYSSQSLGLMMVCAVAWFQSRLSMLNTNQVVDTGFEQKLHEVDRYTPDERGVPQLHVSTNLVMVLDEAWALLSDLQIARWLRASWKLSRAYGVANVAVVHRLSDLQSVGAVGSEQVGIAQGLLSDSETHVVYGQANNELETVGELLGLSGLETRLVGKLKRARALWKIGERSFLVEHVLSSYEKSFIDTDKRMREEKDAESGWNARVF
jgi:hypothetical protein